MQTDPIGSLISCGLFIINVEDVFEPSDNLPSKEVGEDSHQHGVEEGDLEDGVGDDTRGYWVGADGGGLGVTWGVPKRQGDLCSLRVIVELDDTNDGEKGGDNEAESDKEAPKSRQD